LNGSLNTQRLVALFLVGLVVFGYPLLSLFSVPKLLLGVPVLYLYLFGAWLAIIAAACWLLEGVGHHDDNAGG
jgi:O-antigen/teichoic acid export membrane protein